MYLEKLARLARISPLRNSHLYHRFRFERKKKECDKVIATFLGNDVSAERKKQIIRNMRHAMVEYHWEFDEYFLLGYEGKTHEERMKFVSEYDKNSFCDIVNNPKLAAVFHNKWETYKVFKEFFKRDAVLLRGLLDVDSQDVDAFVAKHQNFIIKPLCGSFGKGVKIIRAADKVTAKENLRAALQEHDGDYIVEELIKQVDEIAAFHPESVNTVRIRTFNVKGEILVIKPIMRFGCGDSVVDNIGGGGVFAPLDEDTGTILSAAADEYDNLFTDYPDTRKRMVGFTIPRWKEAVDTAKNLARILPDVKYISWDLALTEKGWVLVEGNDRGQFGNEEFRDELNEICRKLK